MRTILYALLFSFLIFGCDTSKPDEAEAEEQVNDTESADAVVEQIIEQEPEPEQQKKMSAVTEGVVSIDQLGDKYVIVIGSFENANLAKQHAEKFKNLGYQTQVVAKGDGFHMVTAKAFDTFRSAKANLPEFRKKIAHHSWVYINDSSFGK